MSPIPWPLIGRIRRPQPEPPRAPDIPRPTPHARPAAWTPPGIGPDATPYPAPGYPLPAGAPFWIHAEADRLRLLAEKGGDLHAHRTVHLEDL